MAESQSHSVQQVHSLAEYYDSEEELRKAREFAEAFSDEPLECGIENPDVCESCQ
jgi:hypothetical protein